jgi:uncharacterized membrane protein YkoI
MGSTMKTVAALLTALGLLSLSAGVAFADPQDNRDHRGDHHRGGQDNRGPDNRGQGGHSQGQNHGGPVPHGPYHGPPPQGRGYGGPVTYRPMGRTVPLDGVVGQLRRRYPSGRLLDAEMQDQGGRPVYHVHWATGDGRRIDYLVDAQTGAIIGEEH